MPSLFSIAQSHGFWGGFGRGRDRHNRDYHRDDFHWMTVEKFPATPNVHHRMFNTMPGEEFLPGVKGGVPALIGKLGVKEGK